MRKKMKIAAATIALVAGGAVLLVDSGARAADTRVSAGTSSDPLKFLPKDITVPIGTTVIWTNESSLPHDVSAENGLFDSRGTFEEGEEYRFTFNQAGTFPYFCTPHKDAGMVGTVTVSGGGATPSPTTGATTATTAAPAPRATTTTTRKPAAPSTTTTRAGAGDGGSSTTTTTAGAGVTSTTQAAATTPTSAPETADVTTTTEGHGGEESAAETHGSAGGSDKKTNPIVVGLAGILTAVLAAISFKLLTAKP